MVDTLDTGKARAAKPAKGPAKGADKPKAVRDPEGTRLRILEAARDEFARYGLGGARVDRIAERAGTNKRMLYYHVGNKEELFLAVLEEAYGDIRRAELGLSLETMPPAEAVARLIAFTWNYFLRTPEFMALLNNENLYRAKHLRKSAKIPAMHSPFVALLDELLRRGAADGSFRAGIDPVQLYVSIASLAYFYLSNVHTLSVIFDRDLMAEDAREARLRHMTDLVLSGLKR